MTTETMGRLRGQSRIWRSAAEAANDERSIVNELIIQARQEGHSYRELREATGLGVQTLQMLLLKAGID